MSEPLTRDQAVELAYGLLWLLPTVDRRTRSGELAHRARTTLHAQLDRDGRIRGVMAAQKLRLPDQVCPIEIDLSAGIESMIDRPYGQEKQDVICMVPNSCGWPTCGCGRDG